MIVLTKGGQQAVSAYSKKNGTSVSAHFRHAAVYAHNKHKGQFRANGTTPYINHPIAVASILHYEGGINDPITLIGAILHDTIEDTPTTHDEIERLFGKPVADIVMHVTNNPDISSTARKQAQIDNGSKRCDRANAIKLADKIANIRDMVNSDWSEAKKRSYVSHAKKVVAAMPRHNKSLKKIFDSECKI